MGVPDEESWFRRSYLPGGLATGWRRTGGPILIGVAAAAMVGTFIVAAVH